MVLGGFLGCVEGDVVYVEQPLWTRSAERALDFLGYSDLQGKLTACGNCHAGVQAEWQETAHAGAWATLQGSGHAADYCEGCHTVGHLGNLTTSTNTGYAATVDIR